MFFNNDIFHACMLHECMVLIKYYFYLYVGHLHSAYRTGASYSQVVFAISVIFLLQQYMKYHNSTGANSTLHAELQVPYVQVKINTIHMLA